MNMVGLDFWDRLFLAVEACQLAEVSIQVFINRIDASLHLGSGKVTVSIINRLESTTVNGNQRLREQVHLFADHHKLPTGGFNRQTVIFAKVGDCFEVWSQTIQQPHQLKVAVSFAL